MGPCYVKHNKGNYLLLAVNRLLVCKWNNQKSKNLQTDQPIYLQTQ